MLQGLVECLDEIHLAWGHQCIRSDMEDVYLELQSARGENRVRRVKRMMVDLHY